MIDIDLESDSGDDSEDDSSKEDTNGSREGKRRGRYSLDHPPSEFHDDYEEYTVDYDKAKKLFRRVHRKTQEMRLEQIQYIVNTFKILILFL